MGETGKDRHSWAIDHQAAGGQFREKLGAFDEEIAAFPETTMVFPVTLKELRGMLRAFHAESTQERTTAVWQQTAAWKGEWFRVLELVQTHSTLL